MNLNLKLNVVEPITTSPAYSQDQYFLITGKVQKQEGIVQVPQRRVWSLLTQEGLYKCLLPEGHHDRQEGGKSLLWKLTTFP